MRSRSLIAAGAVLAMAIAAGGCGGSAAAPAADRSGSLNGGIAAGALEVTVARPSLTLRNTTEQVVTYFVFEKETLTRATFPPCGDQTTRLVQGAQVVVPYSAITGYSASATEAAVFWCALVRGTDGVWKPLGAMQSKMIRL